MSRLNAVQAALTPQNAPQSLSVAHLSSPTPVPAPPGFAATTVQAQTQADTPGADCDTRRDLQGQALVLDAAGQFVHVGAIRPETVATEPTVPESYKECLAERGERWRKANKRDPIPNFAVAVTESFHIYDTMDLAQYITYIAEVTAPCQLQLRGRGAQAVERTSDALAALEDRLRRSRGAGWIRSILGLPRYEADREANVNKARRIVQAQGCKAPDPTPPRDKKCVSCISRGWEWNTCHTGSRENPSAPLADQCVVATVYDAALKWCAPYAGTGPYGVQVYDTYEDCPR